MANTNIHYYAGFLLLFVIVVFPVAVALVVNVCPLTSKHTLRTSLFSMSWLALRCVAHKSRKQTEDDQRKMLVSSKAVATAPTMYLTFAAIAQFNQNKFNTYVVHCGSHLIELKLEKMFVLWYY